MKDELQTSQTKLYKEVKDLYEQGQFAQARDKLKEVLIEKPEDPDLWCLEARIRISLDDADAAIYAIEQACQFAPDQCEPYLLQADFYNSYEQFKEAAEASKQAVLLATNPEQKRDALFQQGDAIFGMVHQELFLLSEDLEDESEYIRLPPELEAQLGSGLEIIDQVIDLDPNFACVWELRANYMDLLDLSSEALEAWRQAVRIEPQNPDYVHGLAKTLEDLEEFDEAHSAYNQLYALDTELFGRDDAEPLLFAPKLFATTAQETWADIQNEMIADSVPLLFEFDTAIYPPKQMMEASTAQSLMDPRTNLHIEVEANLPHDPIVRLLIFQRNIERDLPNDDPDELYYAIREIMEHSVERILDYVADAEIEE